MQRSFAGIALLAILLAGCGTEPRTLLEHAAAAGNIAEIERLIKAGDYNLTGALIWAARTGSVAAIPVLVRHGANPNGTSGVNDWNVLMHAIHKEQAAAVCALLDAGADPNARAAGGSPLTMAAGYGDAGMVRTLLVRGAKPDQQTLRQAVLGVRDIDNGRTGKCQTETVRLLVDRDRSLVTPGLLARFSSKLQKCPDLRAALTRPVQRARGD